MFGLKDIRRAMFPTKQELNISEAKKLVKSLMSKFSIEEQSEIALQIRIELIEERKQEIRDTEKHLDRLKDDLTLLEKNHVNI